MKKTDYFSINFNGSEITFLDQTLLPGEEVYVSTESFERISEAIEKLEIRGAPLIGIAAAYALSLSQKPEINDSVFEKAYIRLSQTRPTAVNLFWALDRIKTKFEKLKIAEFTHTEFYKELVEEAILIHQEDKQMCSMIAENGVSLFSKKMTVLTHCNTG
ncbi:MAG: S-methyl-5-thioribose-1-phosphate isomerase, partial [Ignavibacteriaceae bacterium]|nr:S-methyl-5-thioribose-1-phosphate isomerase [Ignavibacteriaceae bacterium]